MDLFWIRFSSIGLDCCWRLHLSRDSTKEETPFQWEVETTVCKVLGTLGTIGTLTKSSGNSRVFQCASVCHVAP